MQMRLLNFEQPSHCTIELHLEGFMAPITGNVGRESLMRL